MTETVISATNQTFATLDFSVVPLSCHLRTLRKSMAQKPCERQVVVHFKELFPTQKTILKLISGYNMGFLQFLSPTKMAGTSQNGRITTL